ncbi:hypothetical protein D8Y22_02985 [Salinadaptatus halalkaliphilus]|uniref:HEAT repeat domain-containing protein n=1 Tax=Salinadaptatus halalkaliphilus TaxID=2419781 RepID=A0A4S3TSA0_9EURY|nr:HEAT repeat domain-containing protein [Salinadaptatus halalkaliphilus]THE66255.1 hypothetical protein D8Y22_02985 [Salinadaptatus halalkaliphilus]
MDGDVGSAIEECRTSRSFDVPTLLANLESGTPAERQQAVRTIAAHVNDQPDACLATVPKLRTLLGEPSTDCHEEVATCLAELAAYSPTDVAPSTDSIVAFVADKPAHAATPILVRCLESIATVRPAALTGHVAELASGFACDDPDVRAGIGALFVRIATSTDATLEGADERLIELLADDHAVVRSRACLALGHGNVTDARDRLETLAADDPDSTVREHASRAVERLS